MKVIVVDDSAAVRERIVALLGDVPGVEVVGVALDAPSALALAATATPHAIVLDLSLRDSSGLDVLAQLKRAPAPPLVIVLTNHADEHHRRQCLALGADFFFDKSSQFEMVADVLGRVAGSTP